MVPNYVPGPHTVASLVHEAGLSSSFRFSICSSDYQAARSTCWIPRQHQHFCSQIYRCHFDGGWNTQDRSMRRMEFDFRRSHAGAPTLPASELDARKFPGSGPKAIRQSWVPCSVVSLGEDPCAGCGPPGSLGLYNRSMLGTEHSPDLIFPHPRIPDFQFRAQ